MDQRAHDVEEDIKNILQTRLSLSDKIDTLERHVDATVESTKSAALDALDLARNKAAGFIESTTRHLNPSVQAGRRPWMMVGTAIALGMFAGLMEQRRRRGIYRYYPANAHGADVMPEDERSHEPSGVYPFYGRERPRRSGKSESETTVSEVRKPLATLWDEVTTDLAQERDRLQGAVMHAARVFIHDLVRIAGDSLLDQLNQLNRSTGSPESRQAPRLSRYE